MRFTSTAHRTGRWWVVQCDQHPGALSQVTRLDQAAEHQREAIAFVTELPEDAIEVTVRPVLQPEISETLQRAAALHQQAADVEREAAEQRRAAARKLRDEGLSLRDIAVIFGVSYQRVHQLLGEQAASS